MGVFVLWIAAAAVAAWLTALSGKPQEPSYAYIGLCGAIAICAMILPGISGAMILLILGVYLHLTDTLKNLLHGQAIAEGAATVAVFGAGAAVSLILFSKFLRWLLANYEAPTMAALCGLLLGALPKLWPFQIDLTPEVEAFKKKQFELAWPEAFNGRVVVLLVAAVLAALLVVGVDRWMQRREADGKEKSPR